MPISRLATLLCLIVLAAAPSLAQEQAPARQSPLEKFPKVVAVVNGQTITRERLGQECLKRYGTIVLDNMLNKHLILQACEAKGVKITQQDVNDEIARVANKVGLNTKLFLDALEQERDISPEQYASEIVWPMLALRALAADKIRVTPEEVEKIIQSEYGQKIQVRMIAVSQLEKAQELHRQAVAAPETFRRLAKEHSEDAASASVEGLLPPIRRYSGDDNLERIAFQLEPNEISPVFQQANMHLILQCVRHIPANYPSPQMLPMIRERVSEQLRDQRVGQAADGIFATLQEQSQVIIVLGDKDMEAKYPGVAGYINRQPVPIEHLMAECLERHGREILRGEIRRYVLEGALKAVGKQVVQADIDAEIARAADMAGYLKNDGTPDVSAWLQSIIEEEGATIELYVSDAVWPSVALKKLVEDNVEVTDEDLQKGFEANFGPRAEVLICVLSNQRAAQDVFREAREDLTEQHFGELAAKYSVEPVSRSNFGKIPPIRRHTGNPTLEKTAFDLLPGEISGVLAWGDQYAVLYKQGETKPIVQEFDAVRGELAKELREKKLRVAMREYMDRAIEQAKIYNHLDELKELGGVVQAAAAQGGGQVQPATKR